MVKEISNQHMGLNVIINAGMASKILHFSNISDKMSYQLQLSMRYPEYCLRAVRSNRLRSPCDIARFFLPVLLPLKRIFRPLEPGNHSSSSL